MLMEDGETIEFELSEAELKSIEEAARKVTPLERDILKEAGEQDNLPAKVAKEKINKLVKHGKKPSSLWKNIRRKLKLKAKRSKAK